MSDEINQAREEFLKAIGEAITAWQWVEWGLFTILIRAIQPRNVEATGASFSAIINFNTKLDVVSAALSISINDEEIRDAWIRLEKRAGERVRKRNQIAHLQLITAPQATRAEEIVHLGHPIYAYHKHDWSKFPNPVFTKKQVHDATESFKKLRGDLYEFANRLPEPPRG